MARLRLRRHRGRGQSLVEFALILPLFLLMIMAVFDLGRGVFAFNELSNAAREGVRTAIVNQNDADVRGRAADQAISLGIPSAAAANCPNTGGPTTDPSGICVVYLTPQGAVCSSVSVGCQAVVTVKTTYQAITPLIGNIIGIVPITASSRQSVEATCTGNGCPIP